MTAFPVNHADRARSQLRAITELVDILFAHQDLPLIAWTVEPAGAALTGKINGLAPADQVRASFAAWRAALGVSEHREAPWAPDILYLRAVTNRNRVQVVLTATFIDDGEQQ